MQTVGNPQNSCPLPLGTKGTRTSAAQAKWHSQPYNKETIEKDPASLKHFLASSKLETSELLQAFSNEGFAPLQALFNYSLMLKNYSFPVGKILNDG